MKTKPKAALSIVLLSVLLHQSRPGHAQGAPEVEAGPTHPRRLVSVTISPLHLTLPIVELTTEVRVLDKLGLAAVLGAGKVTSEPMGAPKFTADVWEAGVQGRYYVVGDFRHGMQLGGEVIYMHLSADTQGVSAFANGFSMGGFVGYKVMADVGFTFDTQLGYQLIGVGAKANDGSTTASQSGKEGGLLLNLNVGWSF
ncbi:MAG: hypothetical protein ABJA82_07710 [Myxococcales bacterium]